MITGLFVGVLGTLWFFTRQYELPRPYKIVIHDAFGSQIELDGIRSSFNTHTAAVSFAKHYSRLFPQYQFSLESSMPHIKHRFLVSKNHK